MGKNLYDILDLPQDATTGSIKNAYIRLKKQFEQSLPIDDPLHISQVQYLAIGEAYSILSNPARRELYDQKLIADLQKDYLSDSGASTTSPFKKILLGLLILGLAWLGFHNYQLNQAQNERELLRIKLEREQLILKQEEARLAAENLRMEREELSSERYAALERQRLIEQSRAESRRYAEEVAQHEDKQRRQAERERQEQQREQQRAEAERVRRERAAPIGPTFIR